jgi:hypothetical protein
MPNGWKYTRADGTDHNSGTVDYRAAIGKELVHPHPDMNTNACGQGYHLGKTLRGAGVHGKPESIFRCSYSRKDVLGEDENKVRVSRLRVLEEVPTWKGYGPRGRQVLALIESLPGVPWFSQVGKPYDKSQWAKAMETVDSWVAAGDAAWVAAAVAAGDAARVAARVAARDAAWVAARVAAAVAAGDAAAVAAGDAAAVAAGDAAEIMGGIEDGYFSKLMEVYRAGHYPCTFDGKKLVVF